MCNSQLIQGVIGGILAIVGICLAMSGGNLWGRKLKWHIGLGLPLTGIGLFMLITSFPEYAIGFSVLATLALAFAAFLTIQNADEREKRHGEEELAKERRDRDEHLLNEIIEWAIEIVKVGTPIESAVFVGKIDEEAERRLVLNSLGSLRNDFRAMIAISLYVSRIGLAFGEKLQSSIATLDTDLRKQEVIAIKCQNIVIEKKLSEFDDAWKELIDNWGTLGNSAANVIDEAVIEKLTIQHIEPALRRTIIVMSAI